MKSNFNRRSFFKLSLTSFAVLPIVGRSADALAAACSAKAPAGKNVIQATDSMAKNNAYVADATASKDAKYKAGANCGNCIFYQKAKEDSGHAPCPMMGNKFVSTCGWCKLYKVKA